MLHNYGHNLFLIIECIIIIFYLAEEHYKNYLLIIKNPPNHGSDPYLLPPATFKKIPSNNSDQRFSYRYGYEYTCWPKIEI